MHEPTTLWSLALASSVAKQTTAIAMTLASATTAVAGLAVQDWVAITGGFTTLGLALLSLYQKFREEKRKQDAADDAAMANSQRVRIDLLTERLEAARASEKAAKEESQEWSRLYHALRDIPEDTTTGDSRPTGKST